MDESALPTRSSAPNPFVSVPEALEELRRGRMVIVVDDEDRENEGDLVIAAEHVTPEAVNFMALHGRGLICLSLTGERCDSLCLPQISGDNTSKFGTAFCESVDAREGTTTGISAQDRARTIRQAVDPNCRPSDLARPGHIFPLRARSGGVFARQGQTEASVDLARLAGLDPSGVICEIMNDDGTMARVPDLREFCQRHALRMTSVAELIRYRLATECIVTRTEDASVETEFGPFRAVSYHSQIDQNVHFALMRGNPAGSSRVPARAQLRCSLSDSLAVMACGCARSIRLSLKRIAEENLGVLVYLQQAGNSRHCSGKGTGALPVQDSFARYENIIAARILSDLGVRTVLEMTGGAGATALAESCGVEIAGQVCLEC